MTVLVLCLLLIIIIDFMPILRGKKKNEIWTYAFVLTLGFSILFLHEAGVKIPSPHILIGEMIKKIIA